MNTVSTSPVAFNAIPFTVMPGEVHTVQRGETLSGIARQHGLSTSDLLSANPWLRDPNKLAVGDVLSLPLARPSTAPAGDPMPALQVAQPGETLAQLARQFNNGTTDAPWMAVARGEMGQAEIAGDAHNPRILAYHDTTTLHAKRDEAPWCSAFVNWVLKQSDMEGTGSAAAKSWVNWGNAVDGLANARQGDIVVVRHKSTGDYHVGFYDSAKPGYISLLGGNQDDRVKVTTFDLNKSEVISIRRPPGATSLASVPAAPLTGGGTGVSAPQHGINEADYQALAKQLGVDVAALKAVAQVESRGDGFLGSGKPKILFEAHVFGRLTNHVYDKDYPGLSSPKWNKALYGKGGEHQWERLQEAMKLDPEAALMASSWGRFQILGSNYKAAGYKDVQSFVKAMSTSEAAQLQAFGNFLKAHPKMLEALRNHDWAEFARRYNGAGYAKNHYDLHMQQAYERLTNQSVQA